MHLSRVRCFKFVAQSRLFIHLEMREMKVGNISTLHGQQEEQEGLLYIYTLLEYY